MGKLLVSIHEAGRRFEREVDLLLEQMARHVGLGDLAEAGVLNHWSEHPPSMQNAAGSLLP